MKMAPATSSTCTQGNQHSTAQHGTFFQVDSGQVVNQLRLQHISSNLKHLQPQKG
jgi:hypothetical protein